MKSQFQKVKARIIAFFFIEEGDKRVLKVKKLKLLFGVILVLVCCFQVLFTEENSSLGKSFRPLVDAKINPEYFPIDKSKEISLETKEQAELIRMNSKSSTKVYEHTVRPKQLVYSAKQVIEPSPGEGLMTPLPSGTNFIGKLLNGIDTREANQIVRVSLPYGARHSNGGSIPRNAILLGTATSNGSEKVFVRFNRVIYPSGKEYKIDAQALNSGDYSPGVIGVKQSNADLRMAGSIALTMVSAGADVLTQRSMLGGNPYAIGITQPDATAQNAMLQGISQVTKQEAQRQAQEPQSSQDYVTVFPDSDLIISLLSPYKEEQN